MYTCKIVLLVFLCVVFFSVFIYSVTLCFVVVVFRTELKVIISNRHFVCEENGGGGVDLFNF